MTEQRSLRIGLIGDRNDEVVAHRAIPLALARAARDLDVTLDVQWLATDTIESSAVISSFDGLWCVPASPYRSMDGALLAIRHAREQRVPFLGTCGGFQHAVVEYARHVLGWGDADHAETAPGASRAVIAPLECALVEVTGALHFVPGTALAAAYRGQPATEGYHCRYGLNPAFRAALVAGPLRAAALDDAGDVRAVELDGHPFFVATLFQPERAALQDQPAPPVSAFVRACARSANHATVR